MQQRFIWLVLLPPFVVLFLLGVVGFWQLGKFTRNQAVSELNRSATSTAAKLEREFGLRETVLKRTGEELFIIKSEYAAARQKLDANRAACSAYVKQKKTFLGAPDSACEPFLATFATKGATTATVEDGYITRGEALIKIQDQRINERLTAFKQFFPETLVLLVVNDQKQVISSALSGAFSGSSEVFIADAVAAQQQPVIGKYAVIENFRLGTFAYPIAGGSVLAAYDLDNDNFIRESWESTPIDRQKALAVILDASGQPTYPNLAIVGDLTNSSDRLRKTKYVDINLKSVPHVAVGAEAGNSRWLVVVASPTAVVFGSLRDAQLIGVLIIGILLVSFLWVGAFFIQRTVRSILRLVSGALVFAGGNLDYKINLPTSDAEFSQLAETMNAMAARIAKAEKEIDEKNKEFISVATHELRTPLTAIIGNLSMVSEDYSEKLDPVVKPMLEQAYKGTTRLRDLVNDMLDVARLEGGRAEFVIKPQSMKTIVEGVIETLRVTAQAANTSITYNSAQAGEVLADESRLRIVLNNFVSNAIKYNRPEGSVVVSHSVKDGQLATAIADTGLGIPDEQKAHMFEKFFRVSHEDRKNVVGTGLGMYITRQYVLAMGGKVWFESTHGTGTTFYFTLPLSVEPSAEPHISGQTLRSDAHVL